MKIKLRTIYASAAGCFSPDEIIDLPSDEAIALVNGGYAIAIGSPTIETAALSVSENTSSRPALRKKGR